MSEHRRWAGEDAPDACVECDEPWPCLDAYLTEKEAATRYREALREIVRMDYRGNMPDEQRVARAALSEPRA